MGGRYKGGCHCGNVRFSGNATPEVTFYCHCSDCQRTAGSPFSVELMIPSDSFEIKGELATYTVVGDSGKAVHRRFCPTCGSGVYLECDADPGFVFLKAGTLDDASWVGGARVLEPWTDDRGRAVAPHPGRDRSPGLSGNPPVRRPPAWRLPGPQHRRK